ncbi:Csh2 family CRISPR-associated protein [Thermincola ferriacetica]|uniref:Csh2 family CRISPR-associated protein n=1 Tax=Thermincola ferriacetica TaxID=281456 RepID=A0A0L6W2B1_9FIRM|nr:type I-B CRISPR-associated protein Cas7/Csh2 [Thermincola ferriacetica]KNZ69513.1 Csh2 family CRISPR-associated protein [Thermincola ferriacetica]
MSELIKNNSDILFIYDAKLCNPNGDPDDENRPRMDYEKEINLVSDVRLKRYIRDYLQDKGKEIFVTKVDDRTVDATTRLKILLKKDEITKDDIPAILEKLVDVRLFGATMTIKANDGGGSSGSSITFTGPVQFNWGYSLNRVELIESSAITSRFSSNEGNEQGTIGRDYRLYYSLIAFHGIVSARRATYTKLETETLEQLDEALVKAIPLAATRSKIGQYPCLYLRVEYIDNQTFLGDLRNYIEVYPKTGLRDRKDLQLEIGSLVSLLKSRKEKVNQVKLYMNPELNTHVNGKPTKTDKALVDAIGVEKVFVIKD